MKVLTDGMELEMTVKEYAELVTLRQEEPIRSLKEEWELLQSMRHFKVIEYEWDNDGAVKITMVIDRG